MKLFIQPVILREIGHIRIAKFLEPFREELGVAGIALPPMPDTTYNTLPEPEASRYFEAITTVFGTTERLPGRLRKAVAILEAAASDAERLDAAVQRRMPCVAVNRDCALDRALELWFAAPDELEPFAAKNEESSGAAVANGNSTGSFPLTPALSLRERESRLANGGTEGPLTPTLSLGERENHLASGGTDCLLSPALSSSGGEGAKDCSDQETDEETFCRLARLPLAQYDRVRKAEAARLRIRIETLDAEVARYRARIDEEATRSNIELPAIEAWPEPVNGAETLDLVSCRYTRYVVLPVGAADAIALWTAHAHAFEAFFQTPRLNLYSPERGCGKTTTMDVLASMTPRPLRTENLTAPTLFRVVDQHKPTLLLDEVDAYLNQAEELRGLLNAGHKRGACAYRCEGEGNTVRAFKAFAPAVLAGIGHLPGTLHDRSIPIPLVKALPGEVVARFEEHRSEIEKELGRKLARWARDNFEALKACDPVMPAGAFNRLADNWRPLFAIAEVAGGDWPQRALAAFRHLTANADLEGEGLGVRLLNDIRQIFNESGAERIRSKELVAALCSLADSPWPEAHRGGKPITETWLGHRLRRFGIRSQTLRFEDQLAKGYERADFKEAFRRFLGESGQVDRTG